MRLTILISGISLLSLGTAKAQLLAGQTTGVYHQALAPARVLDSQLTYTGPNSALDTSQRDSLDVDQDGRFDLFLTSNATLQVGRYPIASAEVYVRGGEILKTQVAFRPTAVALASGATITGNNQPFVPGSSSPTWDPATMGGVTDNSMVLALAASNPGGAMGIGEWQDQVPHYVGFRLGNAGAGYRYGWLLVQAVVYSTRSTLTVTSYAMQQLVLPTKSVAERVKLVFGPNPVQSVLHVQLPTEGQLDIYNALGQRCHSQSARSGALQLDASRWPAGTYLVHLTTAQGRAVQRLLKQ